MRRSKWWYLGALGWTVAAVLGFAAYAAGGDGNTLGLAAVAVLFAVLFFSLGRRDAG